MFSVYDKVENNIFGPDRHVFTRAGSYFGVVAKPRRHTLVPDVAKWGGSELHIATGRGGAAAYRSNLCMQLIPVHHGVMVPYAIQTTATEMRLLTAYGTVRMCFAEPALLLIQGENNLGLLLETDLEIHRVLRHRGKDSWEYPKNFTCSTVYTPVVGALDMDAKWDYERVATPQVRGEVRPNEEGVFLLAVEEFTHYGIVRESYPTYAEGLADAEADWQTYLSKMPVLPAQPAAREQASYLTWSLLADPSMRIRRHQIFRSFGHAATSWETCRCAAALSGNLPLAMELMLSQLDEQSPNGQIPACCDDTKGMLHSVTPPAQGWTLARLMDKCDLSQVPTAELEALYDGLSKWVRWYDAYRDDDGDGLPQYEGSEECGYEGSPVFADHLTVELPDLCAFLALLEEKLGDLAALLGKAEARDSWYEASRGRIERMLRQFWNGNRFVGRVHGSGEVIDSPSLVFYRPLILGKRLPTEVIDAMAEDLSEGNGFLTNCGITSHRMTSPAYSCLTPGSGRILPAENALIATGLLWAGKTAQARELAQRCSSAMLCPPSASYPIDRGFDSSVTAADFQLLAELAAEAD